MRLIAAVVEILLVISMIPAVAAWSLSPLFAPGPRRFATPRAFCNEAKRVSSLVGSRARHRHSFRLYSSSDSTEKKRVVFLGTPDVAATTLRSIYQDSIREGSGYELVAVVTQPPKKRGRKKDKLEPSPVAVAAEELGLPAMWPEKVSSLAYFGFMSCSVLTILKCLSFCRRTIKSFWMNLRRR